MLVLLDDKYTAAAATAATSTTVLHAPQQHTPGGSAGEVSSGPGEAGARAGASTSHAEQRPQLSAPREGGAQTRAGA